MFSVRIFREERLEGEVTREMLYRLDSVPDALLDLEARQLHGVLSGPTLITLEGRNPEALFASVLLHGNETSGWEALRTILHRYRDQTLPRSLVVFIGNIEAARHGLRRLDAQPDYNRIWQGGGAPEHAMASTILEAMRGRALFASVDIHNTSGPNPHYAAVTNLRPPTLHLATLFSRTVVYFTRPDTVQCRAFAELCPAVTVECGQPGPARGVEHAAEHLDACLHLSHLPAHAVPMHDIDLFHTVAIVKVPQDVAMATDGGSGDIRFVGDLDQLNFRELPPGTIFARVSPGCEMPLEARDENGVDVTHSYFAVQDGEVRTTATVIPAMLSLDTRIIRQDCLCYLMERYPYEP